MIKKVRTNTSKKAGKNYNSMKKKITLIAMALVLFSTLNAQLVIKNDTVFNTAKQMFLANELFKSGEPFAEALGYDLDLLDPMVPNSPDSISYTLGIEGYEYSRYLLGTVISRAGIGLHMMWSPMIKQMAAMQPVDFDGMFTGGMTNGFKEDDQLMMMVGHFSTIANQMAPMNPFPQFAEFESGNQQLSSTVAPDFAMDFSTLRWDRSKMDKTLNPAALGQSLWKQYYWAKDMLGAFHDGEENTVEADGTNSPDSVDNPHFDPNNNLYYGGNNLDGFAGLVITAEAINKVMFLLNELAYDGTSLGMVDAANYNPNNGIKYFPHRIAVTESMLNPMLPPQASELLVTDASSNLFDQLSLLLGTTAFKNMMDPSINDAEHFAYHEVFDGDPFPAAMSQTGMMGPYDAMAGASMVLFQNIMAMHYNMAEGTFVDVANLDGGSIVMGKSISSTNAAYIIIALINVYEEFAGTNLSNMALDAINAQAAFIQNKLKDAEGGYYNSYTIGSGADASVKTAETQAAVAQTLYLAYQITNNQSYLTSADEAYNFLISNFYVPELKVFRTELGNDLATYNPENLAILAGGLREAALIGNHDEATAIYTRFSKSVYNPMLLAESEMSGETGNDSDGDGIPYIADGKVAPVFAAEGEFSIIITGIEEELPLNSRQNINGMLVYPNPASSKVTLETTLAGEDILKIEILNILGQVVQQVPSGLVSGKISFDVSQLNKGIYFVKLTQNNGNSLSKKIVIK
ncbi:MAG: hypothetical protein CVU09_11345 [Bacteroidetes bacterium HGW-Bacteroidetes-4]|jgi:hypothetical protein|nr:MAG: hypothetical protein CVU09_11345 [Bacteroidetes bacterium HGW-Bacteroidetes-4]